MPPASASPMDIRPIRARPLRVRQLGQVDIARLREAVLAIPEVAMGRRERRQAQPLRGARPHAPHRLPLRQRLPGLARVLRPAAVGAMARRCSSRCWRRRLVPYGYARAAFPRVMLARMAPGGVIKPHRDANPAAKWPHKIHVPLLTNDAGDVLHRRHRLPLRRGRGGGGQQHGRACGRATTAPATAST